MPVDPVKHLSKLDSPNSALSDFASPELEPDGFLDDS